MPPTPAELELYKHTAAVLNYVALDRADISYATKEVCSRVSSPTTEDLQKIKWILRYLKGAPRLQWKYKWQHESSGLTLSSDSDWAGCRRTRRQPRHLSHLQSRRNQRRPRGP